MLRVLLVRPYRCQKCQARFLRWGRAWDSVRGFLFWVAVVVGFVLFCWFVLQWVAPFLP